MSEELRKILGEALQDQAPVVTVPVDVKPFNDMAQFFGAAGTLMAMLQGKDVWNATEALLRASARRLFCSYGPEFCERVVDMVMAYYAQHRPDRTAWDQEVKRYYQQLDYGNAKVAYPTLPPAKNS